MIKHIVNVFVKIDIHRFYALLLFFALVFAIWVLSKRVVYIEGNNPQSQKIHTGLK